MNDTLKTIAERYSCRDFSSAPLTDAQTEAIVKAALAAPSATNRQPWRVIVVTDKALLEEMDEEGMRILSGYEDKSTYERMMSRGGRLFYNAPFMLVVASDSSRYAFLDAGILSQNAALAAHALGLGSVICAMAEVPLNGPLGESFKKRIKFPESYKFGMAVLVGTPLSAKAPHEIDLDKVTYIK